MALKYFFRVISASVFRLFAGRCLLTRLSLSDTSIIMPQFKIFNINSRNTDENENKYIEQSTWRSKRRKQGIDFYHI